MIRVLKTNRLTLRQWTEGDFLPFAEMCSDADVMAYFPSILNKEESFQTGKKIQSLINDRGWGLWAVEVTNQHNFIGFVGLHIPKNDLPFSPCVEIGWRLSKNHWGKGYATEAAKEVLNYAFNCLLLEEVLSFTTVKNNRSRAVMQKIGMRNTSSNFMHPDLEISDALCEHVLYKITKAEWQSF